MRYFLDTEFIEDGFMITLISIGIVAEDGRELYLESTQVPWHRANDWVNQNVRPQLLNTPEVLRSEAQIAAEVVEFVGKSPEFWAYYADYDWVVVCQLYGRMIDLPPSWPMFCLDLKQELYLNGNMKPPRQEGVVHNALEDARWNKQTYDWLLSVKRT